MSQAPWEGLHPAMQGAVKSVYFLTNPDWVWYDEDEVPHLTEFAPPEAVESYNYWLEKRQREEKEGIILY